MNMSLKPINSPQGNLSHTASFLKNPICKIALAKCRIVFSRLLKNGRYYFVPLSLRLCHALHAVYSARKRCTEFFFAVITRYIESAK